MKAKIQDYTTNQGIAIMMEHLVPGKGGRHRQTLSYGKPPNLNLSPRETLAREIWDIMNIYYEQNLYNSTIRKSLQRLIELNQSTWSTIFNKGVTSR